MGSSSDPSRSTHVREFEGGYVFLHRCEDFPSPLGTEEHTALKSYWMEQGWPNIDSWPNRICRWAKLSLPNGQRARSHWHESNVTQKLRRTSCVKAHLFHKFSCILISMYKLLVNYRDDMRIGDVQFYFYLRFGEARHPLAMVHLFSLPDAEVLSDSNGTVYLSEPLTTEEGLVVFPVTAIL